MVKKPLMRRILLLVLVALQLPLAAGDLKKIAQSGMKWLSIPVGARGTAVSAYTAMGNDANAIFWNPAGTAFAEGRHLALNQTQWIADITVNAGAATFDQVILRVIAGVGDRGTAIDNIMFESDFPHPTCLYPDPMASTSKALSGFTDEEKVKVLSTNAARCYNLDLS